MRKLPPVFIGPEQYTQLPWHPLSIEYVMEHGGRRSEKLTTRYTPEYLANLLVLPEVRDVVVSGPDCAPICEVCGAGKE